MSDDENAPVPGGDGVPAESGEYEIGYGKPPKQHQFKTGNKFGKGRPPGSRNMKTIVLETFEAEDTITVNGKRRKLNTIQMNMLQLKRLSTSGNLKAIDKVLDLYERYGPVEDDSVEISDEQLAYDLATLKHHLMMQGEPEDEGEE